MSFNLLDFLFLGVISLVGGQLNLSWVVGEIYAPAGLYDEHPKFIACSFPGKGISIYDNGRSRKRKKFKSYSNSPVARDTYVGQQGSALTCMNVDRGLFVTSRGGGVYKYWAPSFVLWIGCDTQSASHGFTSLSVFVEKNLLSNNWKVDWFDPFCNEQNDVLKSHVHKNLQRKAVLSRMMTPGPLCHRCAPSYRQQE